MKFFTIDKIIDRIGLKKEKSLPEETPEEILEKTMKQEETLYGFTIKILPLLVILGLVFFWIFTSGYNDLDYIFYIFPIYGFAIPFFVIHRKIFVKFRERKKSKSSKSYFENLTYERTFLRTSYVDRLYKISIVILITVALFVGLGLHYTNQAISDNREYYFEKLSEYREEEIKIYTLDNIDLIQFMLDKTSSMSKYSKESFLRNLIFDEITLDAEINQDLNLKDDAWGMATNRIDGMSAEDIDLEITNKIESMNYDQLLEHSKTQISYKKPSSYFYDNESNFKQFNFLLSLALLPGAMFYSSYIYKQFFRQKDFFHNSSIGCFKIMIGVGVKDEITKRKFLKLGIEYYEKFLKKTLNMKFKDGHSIVSKLVIDSPSNIDVVGKDIIEKLETEHHLSLAEYFGRKLKSEMSSILMTDPLINKLKEPLPLIATIISSMVGAIGFLISLLLQNLNASSG